MGEQCGRIRRTERPHEPTELAQVQKIYNHKLLLEHDLLLHIRQQHLQYGHPGHSQRVPRIKRGHDTGYQPLRPCK